MFAIVETHQSTSNSRVFSVLPAVKNTEATIRYQGITNNAPPQEWLQVKLERKSVKLNGSPGNLDFQKQDVINGTPQTGREYWHP